jgi:outer membrane protein assembly factor BamB
MRNATRAVLVGWLLLGGAGVLQAQDWPQWRGPNQNNKVVGFTVPREWPKELTKKWQVEAGVGESSPVMMGGKIYTFGREGNKEVTRCFDPRGDKVWEDGYTAAKVSGPARGFPGARSTPAVGEGKVCTLGVAGVVSCLDAASGKVVWRKDTGTKPKFYTSTSPMIADGKCIVNVAGLTAYDLASGEAKWTDGGSAPYGSPVLMTVDGVKQVVTPTGANTLKGLRLSDGKLLWQVSTGGSGYQGNYSTPLVDGPMVYYSVTGGRGGGGGRFLALKVEKKGDAFTTSEVWQKSFSAAGYHTPLLRDDLIFGVGSDRTFFCVDARTGAQLWKDKTKRGECGSILDAGPVLLALSSDSNLVVFRPSRTGYMAVARYKVSDSETWGVPIVTGNRIYVRDKAGTLTTWVIE